MTWPNQPEYLQLFSNEGPATVRVKFSDKSDQHREMAQLKMQWQELDQLSDPETGAPYLYMFFDTYRCPIKRYEIIPEKNLLTIVVGTTEFP